MKLVERERQEVLSDEESEEAVPLDLLKVLKPFLLFHRPEQGMHLDANLLLLDARLHIVIQAGAHDLLLIVVVNIPEKVVEEGDAVSPDLVVDRAVQASIELVDWRDLTIPIKVNRVFAELLDEAAVPRLVDAGAEPVTP